MSIVAYHALRSFARTAIVECCVLMNFESCTTITNAVALQCAALTLFIHDFTNSEHNTKRLALVANFHQQFVGGVCLFRFFDSRMSLLCACVCLAIVLTETVCNLFVRARQAQKECNNVKIALEQVLLNPPQDRVVVNNLMAGIVQQ